MICRQSRDSKLAKKKSCNNLNNWRSIFRVYQKRCLLLRSVCHYKNIWRKCDSHKHWKRTGWERVTSESENKMIHITDQTNQLSLIYRSDRWERKKAERLSTGILFEWVRPSGMKKRGLRLGEQCFPPLFDNVRECTLCARGSFIDTKLHLGLQHSGVTVATSVIVSHLKKSQN